MKSSSKEKTILKIIKYTPFLVMFIFLILATLYLYIQKKSDFKQAKLAIEKEYMFKNKERIKLNLSIVNKYINSTIKNSEIQLKKELHTKIDFIHSIALNIYEKDKNILSKKAIIEQIKNAIEPIRFDRGNGYFSIHTMEGTNILDREDDSGRYSVREAIEIAKTKGKDFVIWDYYKPNDKSKLFKKVGIIKKFEPYDLVLTTAVFIKDYENIIKKNMLEHLSTLQYANNEYVFVLDTNQDVLLINNIIQKTKYKITMFPKELKNFIDSSNKNMYLKYNYVTDKKNHSKISYFIKVQNSEWIVGTGFNFDKLTLIVQKKENELEEKYDEYFTDLYMSIVFLMLIIFIISFILSKFLEKMFYRYKKELVNKEHETVDNYQKTIVSLVELIEKRDFYTAGHSRRVSQYAIIIAKAMNINAQDISMLEQIGLLHDIGKVGIPDSILLKPGRLDKSEFEIIKSHAAIGYDVISKIPMFKEFSNIILSHHEKYNGSGYPNGLKGDEIPLLASILAIADSFDAMTSTRVYNKTKTKEEAIRELEECSGVFFDPKVVKIAKKVLQNVDIHVHSQAKQLPKTVIERERFAYFFKDSLTNFSNENYLNLLLQQGLEEYKCINLIYTQKFSEYNKKYGWEKGNEFLIYLSQLIANNYNIQEVFRFHGSNFLLLNDTHIEINLDLINKELEKYEVQCISCHMEVGELNTMDTVKEYLNKRVVTKI